MIESLSVPTNHNDFQFKLNGRGWCIKRKIGCHDDKSPDLRDNFQFY